MTEIPLQILSAGILIVDDQASNVALLEQLLGGTPEERRLLAAAVGGRRDHGSLTALADLLVAPDPDLRRIAARSLRASLGDLVPYDPDGEPSELNAAADRVRSLHNRTP